MLTEFINEKLRQANYKLLENGKYFGEIEGLSGVWSEADNLETCRDELREVLEEWILLKIKTGDEVPGFKLDFDRRKLVTSHA